jgi:catechol 2,3-dioxygenase-like lactoylglutathione lyase family enzyme
MDALVKKLMHVAITVPNLDEALRFYRDVLGFTSVFETRTDEADGRLLGFDQDEIGLYAHHILSVGADREQATEINLIEFTDPKTSTVEGPYTEMSHVGITRLALLVESVDEAYERVRAYPGIQVICAPKDIVICAPEVTFTTTWFSFKDPYGVFLTMTQAPRI